MFKRIISGMALATVLVSTASAQVLHYNGGGGPFSYNSKTAYFKSGPDASAPANAFQVWCVDQNGPINANTDYLVTYTKLDGASFASTKLAAQGTVAARAKYTKAAYLAMTMGSDVNDKQYAIWALINGKANVCGEWSGQPGEDHTADCTVADVNTYLADATANAETSIVKSEWAIIDGRNGTDPYGFPTPNTQWNSSGMQELIARCNSTSTQNPTARAAGSAAPPVLNAEAPRTCDDPWTPPNEDPTPEPATMSLLAMGLAGMAGNTLRRRKK